MEGRSVIEHAKRIPSVYFSSEKLGVKIRDAYGNTLFDVENLAATAQWKVIVYRTVHLCSLRA